MRHPKRTLLTALPVALAAALLCVLWISGAGRSRVVLAHLERQGLDFGGAGDLVFSLADGDAHGVISGGPRLSLPAVARS